MQYPRDVHAMESHSFPGVAALLHVYLTITHFECDSFNIKMIFTCTFLETRRQIINIILKSIIIKLSVSELVNK